MVTKSTRMVNKAIKPQRKRTVLAVSLSIENGLLKWRKEVRAISSEFMRYLLDIHKQVGVAPLTNSPMRANFTISDRLLAIEVEMEMVTARMNRHSDSDAALAAEMSALRKEFTPDLYSGRLADAQERLLQRIDVLMKDSVMREAAEKIALVKYSGVLGDRKAEALDAVVRERANILTLLRDLGIFTPDQIRRVTDLINNRGVS